MPAPDPTRRPSPRRHLALLGAALGLGAGCWTDGVDDAANRALLETLPRERRADLLDDLRRFDALPIAEQTAIRRLDATLAALKPDEQARYRSLIQHYHVWFQGLTEEQRAGLRATDDPEERFRQARQLRVAGPEKSRRPGSRIARLRSGDFGLVGPFEMAGLLQAWFALPPERRAAVDRKPWAAIRDELRVEARTLKPRPETLPPDLERRYDAQLRDDGEFRPLIDARVRRVDQANSIGKVDAARKAENALRRDEHPFAEFLYFEVEEHPPKAVAPDRLARFADSCPDWLRAQTDSLSGDDARAYYTILYRLIYPVPKEMPDPAPSARPKSAPGKSASPAGGPAPPVL